MALARANTEKHNWDVLTECYILSSDPGLDGIRYELIDRCLDNELEVSDKGFAFWTPEGTHIEQSRSPLAPEA